jgi:hypothetical protein
MSKLCRYAPQGSRLAPLLSGEERRDRGYGHKRARANAAMERDLEGTGGCWTGLTLVSDSVLKSEYISLVHFYLILRCFMV